MIKYDTILSVAYSHHELPYTPQSCIKNKTFQIQLNPSGGIHALASLSRGNHYPEWRFEHKRFATTI